MYTRKSKGTFTLSGIAVTMLSLACGQDPTLPRAYQAHQAVEDTSGSTSAGPNLGAASGFATLGVTAVTLTTSSVKGDVGAGTFTQTGGSIEGNVFASGVVTQTDGTVSETTVPNSNTQVSSDFAAAYDALGTLDTTLEPTALSGTLSNVTLAPGVYRFSEAATLTGVLTLTGPTDGVWVLIVDGALTGTAFSVVMEGDANPANVYWRAFAAATMTDSSFQGSILAGADITVTGGTFNGKVLTLGAVTMTDVAFTGTVAAQTPGTDTPDASTSPGDDNHTDGPTEEDSHWIHHPKPPPPPSDQSGEDDP